MEKCNRNKILQYEGCKTIYNRDMNAASNILRIAVDTINGHGRPEYLKRNTNRAH